MAIPEGYEKLAVIGIAWKGDYTQGTAYKTMNGVYYGGSTYVALRDNPTGPPAADGANWQYLAKGFVAALLNMITATDTSGVLGEAGADVGAQLLMDAIADKVMTKLLNRSAIVQTESTDMATVPSSPYVKQKFDKLNSDLGKYYSLESAIEIKPGTDLNTLTNFGNYYCNSGAETSTLSNCPITGTGFVMHIERVTGSVSGNYLKQRIIVNRKSAVEYWRVVDSGSWGDWVYPLSNADIQQGRIPTLICAPNQITNYTLTFPKAFSSAPKVMVTLNSSTISAKYGSILPFVKNVTLTSCVVCVANNADIQFSPNVDWLAVGL